MGNMESVFINRSVGGFCDNSPVEHKPTAWTGCLQSSGDSALATVFQPETAGSKLAQSIGTLETIKIVTQNCALNE